MSIFIISFSSLLINSSSLNLVPKINPKYEVLLYKLLLIIEGNRPELLCYKEKIKLKVLVIRKKNVVRNISIKLLIKILYGKFNKYIRINF